jgi:hypothetical protein
MGTVRIGRAFDHARRGAAVLAAGLLVAACSNLPWARGPQTVANAGTLAALGEPPALDHLEGLAPGQVTALIGDPDLRRIDPPAEIWQYRSADCVLELYFYDSGTTSRMVYAEAHSRWPESQPAAGVSCSQNLGPLISANRQIKL